MTNPATYEMNDFYFKNICNKNILLTDDNLLNVKLVSILLTQIGMKVQTAKNGVEAVNKLKTAIFDIVLMDIEMPVMSGKQAAVIIREDLKNNIPIIAMSANYSPGEKDSCLQLGMNDYILKPINSDQLFAAIYDLTCCRKTAEKNNGITQALKPAGLTEKVCNIDYLVSVTRGNKEMMNNIIHVFLEETPEELTALADAIEKTNYTSISDIAHKIKSSFAILGISVLESVFEKMENLGTLSSGIEIISQLNQQVHFVFNQVKIEMELTYIKKGNPVEIGS